MNHRIRGNQHSHDPAASAPGRRMFPGLLALALAGGAVGARAEAPLVSAVELDPAHEVRCSAEGSDNWPLAWTGEGTLFTAYGDGWGFEPRVPRKLSNGFAVIEGFGYDFTGTNLRSPSGERIGDGAGGEKASGMLMVGQVLYMWLRNTGNARLLRSRDGGRSWEEASWRVGVSFGHPVFLDFGPAYAGARDDYVYTYSPDGPSAYEPYDGVVLARAPRERVMQDDAWELFAGRNADGSPRWTRSIAGRAPVLENPGRSFRMDVAWNAQLQRYFLVQAWGNGRGGWTLYEAREPWGPWQVVHSAAAWEGGGNVRSLRLPGAWIGEQGRRQYLVFSGGGGFDAFCVRGMRYIIGGS